MFSSNLAFTDEKGLKLVPLVKDILITLGVVGVSGQSAAEHAASL